MNFKIIIIFFFVSLDSISSWELHLKFNLNRILKQENEWFSWRMSISTVSDYSEPIILTKHEELSDNWTSKKKLFFSLKVAP